MKNPILACAEGSSALSSQVLNSTCRVIHMGDVENIARQIEALSPEELAQLRAWFLEFDVAAADPQLEADIQAGKVDPLVQDALRDIKAGKAKPR